MRPLLLLLISASTFAFNKQEQCKIYDGLWVEDPPLGCLISDKYRGKGLYYADSKKFCQMKGGHLAHIKSEAIRNQVIPYLNETKHKSRYHWIGLEAIDHDPGTKFNLSEWHWIGADGNPEESFRDESMLADSCCIDENTQAVIEGALFGDDSFKLTNNFRPYYMPAFCQYPRGVDHCHLFACLNGGSCEQNETRASCSCPEGVSGENCEVLEANCTLEYGDAAVQGKTYGDTKGLTAVFIQEQLRPGTLLGWRISVGTDKNLYLQSKVDLVIWKPTSTADNYEVVFKQSVQLFELNQHGGPTWIPAEPSITIHGQNLMGFHYPSYSFILASDNANASGQPNLKIGYHPGELNENAVLTLSSDMERKHALEVVVALDPEFSCACGAECLNGGTCMEYLDEPWNCSCPPGFTGRDCSIDINECQSNPCGEHGDCVDKVNGYECVCKDNYMGAHCSCERQLEEHFNLEKKDAYLVGAMGQSTTARNYVICAFRCNAVGWCQSFDFVHKNGTCLLNQKKTGVLQDAPGIDHYV